MWYNKGQKPVCDPWGTTLRIRGHVQLATPANRMRGDATMPQSKLFMLLPEDLVCTPDGM